MKKPPFDLDLYCRHIGYHGERAPTLTVLQQLTALHTHAITFENLSSLAGEDVSIALPDLQHKLLVQKRGGYCFEHNLLLWHVLEQFGFTVSGLAGRVRWNIPAEVTTHLGHMLLKVQLGSHTYLVDAGFGGLTLTAPLRMDVRDAQPTTHEDFRIEQHGDQHTLSAKLGDQWRPLYQFELREYLPIDYGVWNWFTATAPQSPFVKELIVALPVATGRHTLRNNRYTWRTRSGEATSRLLTRAAELRAVLVEQFRIPVPDSDALNARLIQIAALGS